MPYPRERGQSWRRQLTARETTFWYGIAFFSYVGASVVEKGLLTWLIGPLWLVAVVVWGPMLADRVRHR
jgi:hypothetical protein